MRIVFLLLFLFVSSYGHKLNLFLTQENETVFVSAYFASGAFCKECKIKVFNDANKLLQEGKTTKKGEFLITQLDTNIHVKVDAGSGHFVENSLKVEKVVSTAIVKDEVSLLQKENQALKREVKRLNEKLNQNELFKIILALLVMIGIFFILKKVKK